MFRPKRVINRNFSATSTIRLIEAMKPLEPDQSPNIILKPIERKRRLPGTAILIKMAKDKEKKKEKEKKKAQRVKAEPVIDDEAVERALNEVLADLGV